MRQTGPVAETSEQIRQVAFRLFSEEGYDATSVEAIVAGAGVSRSTFFRAFGSKEAVIFPDHDRLLAAVDARLRASTQTSALAAVSDAVRLVLFHYIAEGERARERYALTSSVVALRERELISGARYQRLFRQFILDTDPVSSSDPLTAEVMAAAIVAAHNRVLRRWLRRECEDPQIEIDAALKSVRKMFESPGHPEPVLVAVPAGMSMDAVAAALANWAPSTE